MADEKEKWATPATSSLEEYKLNMRKAASLDAIAPLVREYISGNLSKKEEILNLLATYNL